TRALTTTSRANWPRFARSPRKGLTGDSLRLIGKPHRERARNSHPRAKPNSTIAVAKFASTVGHGMKGRPMRFRRGWAGACLVFRGPALFMPMQLLLSAHSFVAQSRQ